MIVSNLFNLKKTLTMRGGKKKMGEQASQLATRQCQVDASTGVTVQWLTYTVRMQTRRHVCREYEDSHVPTCARHSGCLSASFPLTTWLHLVLRKPNQWQIIHPEVSRYVPPPTPKERSFLACSEPMRATCNKQAFLSPSRLYRLPT